ncbi:MAG: glycosyltransferase family 4 protein [Acidobacteriaceae bacterium]
MARTILFLVSSLVRTGPTAVLKGIVNQLDPQEFRPVIVTLSPEGEHSCADEFDASKVERIRLPLGRAQAMLSGSRQLAQIVRATDAAIVHSHTFRPDLLISGAKFDAFTVSTIHSVLADDYQGLYGKIMGLPMASMHYRALRHIDAPVAVSEMVSRAAASRGVRSRVILNGVDTDRYRPAASPSERRIVRQIMNVPEGKKVVLYSGRLISRKRPVQMIDAFRRSTMESDAVLIIAGEGPLLDQCRLSCGSSNNIRFLGSRSDIPELLRGTDYLISAAESEGLPMALLEACASGVRIIASDIPSHREIQAMFPAETLLFSIQHPDGLRTALDSLNPDSEAPPPDQEAIGKISSRIMSENYQKIYRELCG